MLLAELVPLSNQAQYKNGAILAGGLLKIFYKGRTDYATTYNDAAGNVENPNPVILDNEGRCSVYASPDYSYTLVFCDKYGQVQFSYDKDLLDPIPVEDTYSIAIKGDETISVNKELSGQTEVYNLHAKGEGYNGIDPIVVDNVHRNISANHVQLGVVAPLTFVEDSESATVIGFDESVLPDLVEPIVESAISSISGDFYYSAGDNIDITNKVISGRNWTPEIEASTSGKLDESAFNEFTATADVIKYSAGPNIDIQGHEVSGKDWSGEIEESTSGKLDTSSFESYTADVASALDDKQDKITWEYTTGGFISGADGSAFNALTEISANGQYMSANGNEVGLTDDAENAISEVSGKLDTSAFSSVSGELGFKSTYHRTGYVISGNLTIDNQVPSENLIVKISGKNNVGTPSSIEAGLILPFGGSQAVLRHAAMSSGGKVYWDGIEYYAASNPSGFITAIPEGTLNESGFEYDSDNLISGYNGSAFAGQGGGADYSGIAPVIVDNSAREISVDSYGLVAGNNISITDNTANSSTTIAVTGLDNYVTESYLTSFYYNKYYIDYNISSRIDAKQDKLTFNYTTDNKISGINNSAFDSLTNISAENGLSAVEESGTIRIGNTYNLTAYSGTNVLHLTDNLGLLGGTVSSIVLQYPPSAFTEDTTFDSPAVISGSSTAVYYNDTVFNNNSTSFNVDIITNYTGTWESAVLNAYVWDFTNGSPAKPEALNKYHDGTYLHFSANDISGINTAHNIGYKLERYGQSWNILTTDPISASVSGVIEASTTTVSGLTWTGGGAASASLPITGSEGNESATYTVNNIVFERKDTEGEPDIRTLYVTPDGISLNATYDEVNWYGYNLNDYSISFTSEDGTEGTCDPYSISSWNDTYGTVTNNSADWNNVSSISSKQNTLTFTYVEI